MDFWKSETERKWARALILSLLVAGMFVLAGCDWPTGGSVACTGCECRLTTKAAQVTYKVLDDKGGWADKTAEIRVTNLEALPVGVNVIARCHTVDREKQYTTGKLWLQPKGSHEFQINIDAGWGEDWKCDNFDVRADRIDSCEIYGK